MCTRSRLPIFVYLVFAIVFRVHGIGFSYQLNNSKYGLVYTNGSTVVPVCDDFLQNNADAYGFVQRTVLRNYATLAEVFAAQINKTFCRLVSRFIT